MPPSSRVCHNVYISPSKGGFPCCNSPRYYWWSESLHLKWWTVLLHDEWTTRTAKETLYKLQYPPDLLLQSLERHQPVPCIKKHTEIIVLLCSLFPRLHIKSRNHQNNAMLVLSFLMPQILTSGVWDPSESGIEILPSPVTPLTQAADCLRPVRISIVSQGLSSPLSIHTTYECCPALLCCLSPVTSPSGACSGRACTC